MVDLVHEALAGEHRDDDLVARLELVDVAERLAERRAVAGDRGVAELPRQRRVGVVPRALLEVGQATRRDDVQGAATLLADPRDLELGQRLAALDRRDVLLDRRRGAGTSSVDRARRQWRRRACAIGADRRVTGGAVAGGAVVPARSPVARPSRSLLGEQLLELVLELVLGAARSRCRCPTAGRRRTRTSAARW